MTVVNPPFTPYNTSNTCITSIPWGGSVTNYRLHLVYTVFYLYSILVIELMHVSIIVQPTLYITVLHTLTHPS